MKRFVALLLALIMILSLSATAFADEDTKNDSITVNNAKAGETYSLYKLFDLKVNDENAPSAYSYTINSGWAAFFAAAEGETPAGPGNQYITVNEAGYVTAISDAAALAKAAAAYANKPAAVQSKPAAGNTVEFTGLEDGYWLITSTLGTFAMIETTPDDETVTVNEKNPENTITKTVQEDSTKAWGKTNDAQVGDTVYFKSTVKIVKGTRNVVVHDKMYTDYSVSGLAYIADSVEIAGLTKGTEFTVDENPADGDTFDITFDQAWIDSLDFGTDGYKEYEITYSAILNSYPVSNGGPIDSYNKTYVSYGNASQSTEEITTTSTHKFSIYKHAAGSTEHLAGAVFQLKKGEEIIKLIQLSPNRYRVADKNSPEWNNALETFTTIAEGEEEHMAGDNADIFIYGVDADDDYVLVEIEAPNGYNLLKDPISVTVDANNSTRVDVENNAGTELPSTGGVGTTLFYVFGGILVLASFVLLITKKRMAEMA